MIDLNDNKQIKKKLKELLLEDLIKENSMTVQEGLFKLAEINEIVERGYLLQNKFTNDNDNKTVSDLIDIVLKYKEAYQKTLYNTRVYLDVFEEESGIEF